MAAAVKSLRDAFAARRAFLPLESKLLRGRAALAARQAGRAACCRVLRVSAVKHQLAFAAAVPLVPTVHAFWGSKGNEADSSAGKMSEKEDFLKEMDSLHEQHEYGTLYEKLNQRKSEADDEILWRLARAACDCAKMAGTSDKKKELMIEAFTSAERALELNDKNFACHKWYAILLDYTAEFDGTKARIQQSYKVKEHLLKASELNPEDATTIHSLGYWCFLFADMPWYQRKVASVIFSTPPKSTYEEALEFFLKAEKTSPNFYSMNLTLIGKTYLRMGNKEKAKEYLLKARDYTVKTEDDKKSYTEAVELLRGLGVK